MEKTTLIENVTVVSMDDTTGIINNGYIAVKGKKITYVGDIRPEGEFDSVISGKGKAAIPGLVNLHSHVPMTLFRGYAEELPLHRWLEERIFPIEDKLTGECCYFGSLLGIAEMIAGGVTSFSDMYFFCEDIISAVEESGIKANISRGLTCFDPNDDLDKNEKLQNAVELYKQYHNYADGRVKIDMSAHAEYTTNERFVKRIAELAGRDNIPIQVHISETNFEHYDCVERHGATPTAYFASVGLFDTPTVAAHCVYAEDEDFDIMRDYGVTVAHCPVSNLKLGSGIAPLHRMLEAGVRVGIGTDGAASNNSLSMLSDMKFAALLGKGEFADPTLNPAKTILEMATYNGAAAQQRENTGMLREGWAADIVLIDMDNPHMKPCFDVVANIIYASQPSDVKMTMVDGKVIYKDGVYHTLDLEKIYYGVKKSIETLTK